jgi:tetratricopeptide (TPR) repeat protein
MTLMILNRLVEAVKDFETTIELDPEYSKSWYNLGMANQRQGESEKACENIQHAFDLGLKIARSYLDANCV